MSYNIPMDLRPISDSQKSQYNKLVTHVIQSWEWGEFRQKLGLTVLRYGIYHQDKLARVFQLTLHHLPLTKYSIGYLPKGDFPDKELADALVQIARENNCAAIKVEPNIRISDVRFQKSDIDRRFIPSPKPLFTKFNFLLDLTQSEDELLKKMHPKFRYNIKVAQKNRVRVEVRDDDKAFQVFSKLYFSTTKRQGYHGHNLLYHQLAWETLSKDGLAKILIANYRPPNSEVRHPLVAWMLYRFKDTLYYPYGGSSDEHRNLMASNLVAWEAIRLGKKLGLKNFDLWGALDPNASAKDPFQGFHRFKAGTGAKLVEYLGSLDLVLNKPVYLLFNHIDKAILLKVLLLKLFRR